MIWAGHGERVGAREMHATFCLQNLKGKDNLGDLDVDGTIIV